MKDSALLSSEKISSDVKLIFLDIDGVMNHEVWYKSSEFMTLHGLAKAHGDELSYCKSQFSPFSIRMLNYIVDQTGAKIVLSSSWRMGRSLEEIEELFGSVGITGEIIGKTPVMRFTEKFNRTVPRGCEIKWWIQEHVSDFHNLKYVIFDDDGDMLIEQQPFFIQTDSYSGITPTIVTRAVHILGPKK